MGTDWRTYMIVSRGHLIEALNQLEVTNLRGYIARAGSFRKADTPYHMVLKHREELSNFFDFLEQRLLEHLPMKSWSLSFEIKWQGENIYFCNHYQNHFEMLARKWIVLHFSPPWGTSHRSWRQIIGSKERKSFESLIARFKPTIGWVTLDLDERSMFQLFGFEKENIEFNSSTLLHFFSKNAATFFLPTNSFPFTDLTSIFVEDEMETRFVLSSRGFGNEVLLYSENRTAVKSEMYEQSEEFAIDEFNHRQIFRTEILAAFELLQGESHATTPQ